MSGLDDRLAGQRGRPGSREEEGDDQLVGRAKDRPGEFPVKRKGGTFYKPLTRRELSEDYCGLIFIDLIKGNRLNKEVGKAVIESL